MFAHKLPLQHGGGLDYFVMTEEQAFHYRARSLGVTENWPP
jgi:hypothetical protein